MTGIMFWLDTTQTVFTVLVLGMIGLIVYCTVQGVDLENTERHYVVKVSTYDDETLEHASSARIECACGHEVIYTADHFESSDYCEGRALRKFTQHQTEGAPSGN